MFFDTRDTLAAEIMRLLDVLRALGEGSAACLLDREQVLFAAGDDGAGERLRDYLAPRRAALFGLPPSMANGAAEEGLGDPFAEWPVDEGFLLAFFEGRVATVVASAQPEALEARALEPLKALADRVFRWRPAYRSGGTLASLFFSRPRLDLVVVGRVS